MKKYLLTVTLTIFATVLFGQADCIIFFSYKGVMVGDSSKFRQIGLPTTPFIAGYEKKKDQRAFAAFNLSDSSFDLTMSSHLSSEFCRKSEDIVTFFFKRIKEYPIKFFDNRSSSKPKLKTVEKIILTSSINFTYEVVDDGKEIVIDLGRIKF
jgi:hypothetical protein